MEQDSVQSNGQAQDAATLPRAPLIEKQLLIHLIAGRCLEWTLDQIQPVMFSSPRNAVVYEAIGRVYDEHGAVDVALLEAELSRQGQLEEAGGTEWLHELASMPICNPDFNVAYVRSMINTSRMRELIDHLYYAQEAIRVGDYTTVRERVAAMHAITESPAPGDSLSKYRCRSLADLDEMECVEWICNGYLARGSVTLLVSYPKAGKTTLLAALLAGLDAGDSFIGRELTPKARSLVISEESTTLWRRRRDDFGLPADVFLISRPFKGRPSMMQWLDLIDRIAAAVANDRYDLVIIDTLANLWPCENENDAGEVVTALTPLQRITEAGAAVLISHHARKSGGTHGNAARGSNALTGFVDIIIDLEHCDRDGPDDGMRHLKGQARFDETPAELVVSYNTESYTFTALGTRAQITRAGRLDLLRELLPTSAPGLSVEDVHNAWQEQHRPAPSRRTIKNDLASAVGEGWIHRNGTGKRGSPYTFWCPPGAP